MMTVKGNLRSKKITVVGLGVHGGAEGNIRWLHEQGAKLIVTDLKSDAELADTLNSLVELKDIEWVLGEHREHDFTEADMIIRNPAVPRYSKYLELARKADVPVEMDSSLLLKHSPTDEVVGITGTKGKTTTTHAIGSVLKHASPHVAVIGVEGTSPLGVLREATPESMLVFEMSSWRCEALQDHKLSPSIAVFTSLYRDHLNTYDSFEDYVAAKRAILDFQKPDDLALLNYDDELVRKLAQYVKGRLVWYSSSFDFDGDGIGIRDNEVLIRDGDEKSLGISRADLPLVGEHAQRNLLPALYLGHSAGMSSEQLRQAVSEIKPQPHRLEKVLEHEGVTYINDSAATIPDAAVAALDAITDPKVLIAGGNDKELEFPDMAQKIVSSDIHSLILFPGDGTDKLLSELEEAGSTLKPIMIDSMLEAVEQASAGAQAGDVVLLSPGATSFGHFLHEFDRGEKFKEAVQAIAT